METGLASPGYFQRTWSTVMQQFTYR